jgi:hypothetical protein
MSWKGLTHKGTEILTPEEWNKVVDALDELKAMIKGGLAEFTGDGTTTTFNIAHGLGAPPTSAIVGKGASGLPDIDYWTADDLNITVTFKTAPASGATVKIWWIALKS